METNTKTELPYNPHRGMSWAEWERLNPTSPEDEAMIQRFMRKDARARARYAVWQKITQTLRKPLHYGRIPSTPKVTRVSVSVNT